MTGGELWEKFCAERSVRGRGYEAWAFGFDPDGLARLVLDGDKRATTSLFVLYGIENEPLPLEGSYHVILDSRDNAVCIIRLTRVFTTPFDRVTDEYARREGEGDKSLGYWKAVHREAFSEELAEYGRRFEESMSVVCEEFELVYSA